MSLSLHNHCWYFPGSFIFLIILADGRANLIELNAAKNLFDKFHIKGFYFDD